MSVLRHLADEVPVPAGLAPPHLHNGPECASCQKGLRQISHEHSGRLSRRAADSAAQEQARWRPAVEGFSVTRTSGHRALRRFDIR